MQFLIEFLDALLHSEQFFESAKFRRFAEDTAEHIVRPGPHPPKCVCVFWQQVFIGPRGPTFRRISNGASGDPRELYITSGVLQWRLRVKPAVII